MSQIPQDGHLDGTLALLSEGYTFVSSRCRRLSTDIFGTRLMLKPVVCLHGEEAASMFRESGHIADIRAMPPFALDLLQADCAVQSPDESQSWRSGMLSSLLTPARINRLVDLADEEWRKAIERWSRMDRLVLLDRVQDLLCRTALRWAGLPLGEDNVAKRSGDYRALIDGAGSLGPRCWRAGWHRARIGAWSRNVIKMTRQSGPRPDEGSLLHDLAFQSGRHGGRLTVDAASAELINLLRPIVATAHFIAFAALALDRHPQYRIQLAGGDGDLIEAFAKEVRRFFPFLLFIGGVVRQPFRCCGHAFARGDLVLLDLYGTNHDQRLWNDPDRFRPERFRHRTNSADRIISLGAAGAVTGWGHAGRDATALLLQRGIDHLSRSMTWQLPDQDLSIDLSRLPARPRSGVIMAAVRPI